MKKILVIGGACQGKTKWVQENFQNYYSIDVEKLLEENHLEKYNGGICINQFHMIMKRWLKEEKDYKQALSMLRKTPSWLIISDEIGNGIVPVDREDRRWREETGRVLCELAKDADEVYRIYCGIATKIKGGDVPCYSHFMRA